MDVSDFIELGQREPPLKFLIIGGYAVAAHGHARATFDVDFLARRTDREAWVLRAVERGLKLVAETKVFVQFSSAAGSDGFDLMLVDDATFGRMWDASEERDYGASTARIPSLDHLLALKLHALRQQIPHRVSKDAEDIEMLVRRNGLDLSSERCKELFLKHGSREIYEPSSESSGNPDSARPSLDLDLPDGEKFRSLPPLVSINEMIRRSKQIREWFPKSVPTPEERWRAKTDAEFFL